MKSFYNPNPHPGLSVTNDVLGASPNLLSYNASGLNSHQGYPNVQQNAQQHHQVLDARSSVRHLTGMIPEWKGHFDLADTMLASQENTLNNINAMVAQLYAFYEQFQNTLEFSKSTLSDINLQQEKLNNEMAERLKGQDMQNLVTIKSRRLCEVIIGARENPEPGSVFRVPNHINVDLSKELFDRVRTVKSEVDFIQNEVQLLKEVDVFKAPTFIESVLISHETRIATLGDNLTNMLNRAEATLQRDLKREIWNALTNQTTNLRRNFMKAVGLETPKPYDLDTTPMTELKRQIRYLRNFNASYNDPNFPYLSDYGYNIKDLLVNTVPNQGVFIPGSTAGAAGMLGPLPAGSLFAPTSLFGAPQPQQPFATGLSPTQTPGYTGTQTPTFGTSMQPGQTSPLGTTQPSSTQFGGTTPLGTTPFSTQPQTTSPFGTTQTGPFGATTPTTQTTQPLSLQQPQQSFSTSFSQTQTPPFSSTQTGPFGTTKNTAFSTTTPSATSSIFGTAQPQQTQTTNLFTQTQAASTSPFGTTQPTTGLFSQTQQTQPAGGIGSSFSSGTGPFTSGTSIFPTQQQPQTNLFAQATPTTTTSFTTSGTSGGGIFGTQPQQTQTSLFSQPQQTQTSSFFTSQSQQPQATAGPFGQTTTTALGSNAFGTGFGNTSTTTTTAAGPFGGSPFGVSGSTVGTGQQTGLFGQQQQTQSTGIFGQNQPSTGIFGNTSTATSPFGSTNTAFASTSGTLFGTNQAKPTGTELALYNPNTGYGGYGRV